MPVPIDKLNYALSSTCLQMEDLCGRLSMFGARNSYNIFRWSDEVCNELAIQVEGFLIKSSIESVEAKHVLTTYQFRPSCLVKGQAIINKSSSFIADLYSLRPHHGIYNTLYYWNTMLTNPCLSGMHIQTTKKQV